MSSLLRTPPLGAYGGLPLRLVFKSTSWGTSQTAVISSRANHAMLLDCRDLSRQFVPIDANDVRVVVVNSMVKHELTGGEYAERRRQCEEGVRYFQKANPAVRALASSPLFSASWIFVK